MTFVICLHTTSHNHSQDDSEPPITPNMSQDLNLELTPGPLFSLQQSEYEELLSLGKLDNINIICYNPICPSVKEWMSSVVLEWSAHHSDTKGLEGHTTAGMP